MRAGDATVNTELLDHPGCKVPLFRGLPHGEIFHGMALQKWFFTPLLYRFGTGTQGVDGARPILGEPQTSRAYFVYSTINPELRNAEIACLALPSHRQNGYAGDKMLPASARKLFPAKGREVFDHIFSRRAVWNT